MANLIEYSNGLRLVVENNSSIRSVAASIWVRTGSANENIENNGISHFLEHVLFKGTDKMSAFEIANAFESKGASVNAFTAKEFTCFYFKSIDSDTKECFKVLCDIFFNSTFEKKELDVERNVVIEEINMDDDSPEDICYDLLAKSLYGKHSLGMTVLGPRENVMRFEKADLEKYIKSQYTAEGIVIAMVGNIDLEKADQLTRKYFLPYVQVKRQDSIVSVPKCEVNANTFIKDFKQSNLMLGYPSISIRDKKIAIQSVLNVILGGCMGSRLFQNIRERKGLAYSVYSSPSRSSMCGSFNIALNINGINTEKVLESVLTELNLLMKDGVTEAELKMAKAQLKSNTIFGQENLQTVMLALGRTLLIADEVYDIDKVLSDIDSVTLNDVNDMANKTFKVKPAIAYVGIESGVDFNKI